MFNLNSSIENENGLNGGESIVEYDITAIPRDFTPSMIVDLIDAGIIEIPLFQRNFVWDINKASRLVESLILGLPVPELFLYSEGDEESRYKIIDGQQRILSIYFFVKGRFPKNNKTRISIRNSIPDWSNENVRKSTLADNDTFKDFELELIDKNEKDVKKISRYEGNKFDTLDPEMKVKFRLRRSLRGVVVRQNKPDDGLLSMFEIFNRLNTGGIHLGHQEVRASLFYCNFYEMLNALNEDKAWRKIYGSRDENGELEKKLHCEDIEVILRGFAFYYDFDNYSPKMELFLNRFSQKSKTFSAEKIEVSRALFNAFLKSCSSLPDKAFFRGASFSETLFDSVFVTVCNEIEQNPNVEIIINTDSFNKFKNNEEFKSSITSGSSSKSKIELRFNKAKEILVFDKVN